MLDGTKTRQIWRAAFEDAQSNFRSLLTGGSAGWKRVHVPTNGDGSNSSTTPVRNEEIHIHRKGDMYRAMLDLPIAEDDKFTAEQWRAVLTTPEVRKEWDNTVESNELLEMFDLETRIVKTRFIAGWPANPRDSITMSRTFGDSNALIDITTSVPRSPDEPGYLRPSPPYVRSSVKLMAWCIQFPTPPPITSSISPSKAKGAASSLRRIRIILFHCHDLKLGWPLSSSNKPALYLSTLVQSLLSTVREKGSRVPIISAYGLGVSLEYISWDVGREVLSVEYVVYTEGEGDTSAQVSNLDDLQALKERRRLQRAVEYRLPQTVGWDIAVSVRSLLPPTLKSSAAGSKFGQDEPWTIHLGRLPSTPSSPLILTIFHSVPKRTASNPSDCLRIAVSIEVVAPQLGIRVNGHLQNVNAISLLDLSSLGRSKAKEEKNLADLVPSDLSLNTFDTEASSISSGSTPIPQSADRSLSAQKAILTRVKRSYIYFTSLLQEPEAKWKRYTEVRGVTLSILTSIDPTLLIYRAEAVFVGVGMWDLMSAVWNWGIRASWDRSFEEALLLEDLGDVSLSGLSELWLERGKGGWNVSPRESIILRTVYKSPSTVHVFGFSSDDMTLFPSIPGSPPIGYTRSQTDLQGFAIEALSPNTTSLTLLSQGGGQPNQLASLVSGMGEYVIKNGAPPILCALRGGKIKPNGMRYENERNTLRIEYGATSKPTKTAEKDDVDITQIDLTDEDKGDKQGKATLEVECELRCDVDSWCTSLELVIDPPPREVTAFRRHRLSPSGGLWLTISHSSTIESERILVLVRKGKEKEKNSVYVNGTKVEVDSEELDEKEVARLLRMKRVKPPRVPLDVPPLPARRKKTTWDSEEETMIGTPERPTLSRTPSAVRSTMPSASTPPVSSPLVRMWNAAVEQTQQAVNAVSPPRSITELSPERSPAQDTLSVLAYLQKYHSRAHFDGWALATGKDKEFPVSRKSLGRISPSLPVYKGEKVIEGSAAEEVASFVSSFECRKVWDDRFDGGLTLENYGTNVQTAFICLKSIFPFRDRGFHVCCASARSTKGRGVNSAVVRGRTEHSRNKSIGSGTDPPSNSGYSTIFYAMTSFHPDHTSTYAHSKYNSYDLPIGRIFIDGWIFETLDPYTTTEHYAIPSMRCTRLVAIDFAGSMPAAYNSMINTSLPRSILALERYLKSVSPTPFLRVPTTGFYIIDDDDDDELGSGADTKPGRWTLDGFDEERMVVWTRQSTATRTFRAVVKLKPEFQVLSPLPVQPTRTPLANVPLPQLASSTEPERVSTPTRHTRANTLTSSSNASMETVRRRLLSTSSSTPPTLSRSTGSPPRPLPLGSIVFPGSPPGPSLIHPPKSENFLAAEVVIDTKLYPEGYNINLRAKKPSSDPYPTMPQHTASEANSSENPTDGMPNLPLTSAIYTLPSTPLHSTSNGVASPDARSFERHLLRLTLATARYYAAPVEDPLTGEMRHAPEKPAWLLTLEENGAYVEVEIEPGKSKTATGTGVNVSINGEIKELLGEKDSLSVIGRAALEGEKEKRGSLQRYRDSEGDLLPKVLKTPLAVAFHLRQETPRHDLLRVEERASNKEDDLKYNAATQPTDESANEKTDENKCLASTGEAPTMSSFMQFLQSYSKPLLRFSSQSPTLMEGNSATGSKSSEVGSQAPNGSPGEHSGGDNGGTGSRINPLVVGRRTSSQQAVNGRTRAAHSGRSQAQRLYPLPTVIIIALISFLVGSLLRSLLSPAEFVAEMPRMASGGEGRTKEGVEWREIKRLVEIKYLAGGWDFVVAVVRRP